jgi:WD40 repeat protein
MIGKFQPDSNLTIFINYDSEIRVWTIEGDPVYTLSGHTSFVYSLGVLPNGDIVSGGEDRSVRIWRGDCGFLHPLLD